MATRTTLEKRQLATNRVVFTKCTDDVTGQSGNGKQSWIDFLRCLQPYYQTTLLIIARVFLMLSTHHTINHESAQLSNHRLIL